MNLRASLDLVLEYPFIWQSTLWLLLGLGVSRWFERHPARAHAVLLAALTGAVVSPAVSLLAGRLGWSLLPHRVVEVGGGWTVAPGGVLQASAQRVDMVLYAVSGLMIGVCLLGFVRSLSSARRMLRDCSPVTDPEAIRALALTAKGHGWNMYLGIALASNIVIQFLVHFVPWLGHTNPDELLQEEIQAEEDLRPMVKPGI